MKSILIRLRREQHSIIATLDKAKRADIQTSNGRNTLRELQKKLTAHKEFRNRSTTGESVPSEDLKKLLQGYNREIDALIKKIDKFTNPVYLATIQGKHCHHDFSRMVARFRHKICKDEYRFFTSKEDAESASTTLPPRTHKPSD